MVNNKKSIKKITKNKKSIRHLKKNKSLLGKIGFFFVGNIIVGLASGLVIRPKIVKNNAEIKKLEGQQQNLQTIVDAGTNLVNNAINNG